MTTERVRARAREILTTAVGHLRRDGCVTQVFFIHTNELAVEMLPMPGAFTNSTTAKRLVAALLDARTKVGDVEAVFMVCDTFLSSAMTQAQHEEVMRRGLSVEGAAAAGLCELHEALIVTAETPLMLTQLTQRYRRDAKDQDKVELLGEPEELSNANCLSGRFIGHWPEPAGKVN